MNITRIALAIDSTQVRSATAELRQMQSSGVQTQQTVRQLGRSLNSVDSSQVGIADRRIDDLQQSAIRTERAVVSMGNSIALAGRLAAGAAAGFAASFSVGEVVRYSDAWSQANNQLRQVTETESELRKVRSELLATSLSTNAELGATVELYSSLYRSTRQLGTEQATVARVTETINNLFKAGGKSAAETAGAIFQLSQGLAAGALRGDEFNSVAEGAPRIMDALAKATGLAIGELRDFAAEGKITADLLVRALADYSEEAQRLADLTEETFGQKLVNARTNAAAFVGEANSLSTAVDLLGDGIVGLSENLETIVAFAEVATVAVGIRLMTSVAASGAGFAASAIQAARYQATLATMAGVSARAAAGQLALAGATRGAGAAFSVLGGPIGAVVVATAAIGYYIAKTSEAERPTRSLGERISALTTDIQQLDDAARGYRIDRNFAETRVITARLEELQKAAEKTEKSIANALAAIEANPLASSTLSIKLGFDEAEKRRLDAEIRRLQTELAALNIEKDELTGDFVGIGDPFATAGKAEGQNEYTAHSKEILQEIELLRKKNDLIQDGFSLKEVDAQIDEQRLRLKLEDQKLTTEQIDEYIRLKAAIEDAERIERVDTATVEVEREIALLREQIGLIRTGTDAKLAAQQVDDLREAAALRGRGIGEQQIKQMIEARQALRDLNEEEARRQELEEARDSLVGDIDRLREAIDPLAALNNDLARLKEGLAAGLIDQSDFDTIADGLRKIHDAGFELQGTFTGIGKSIDDMSGGTLESLRIMQRVFDDGSKGYQQLEVAIQAVNALQAINAVLNQSAGDPYTAFARMATMAAAVASLGYSVGGLGGQFSDTARERQQEQGTGTVLGLWDEKSESIARASEITANATTELVGLNRGMLTALQNLRTGIGGATGQIARDARGASFDYRGQIRVESNPLSGAAERFRDGPLQIGFLDDILDGVGKLLGGSSKVTDQGVKIIGGTLAEMIDEVMLQSFQETQYRKYAWSSRRTVTAFADLDEDTERQFQLVFQGIADSVSAGADALGLSATEISKAIAGFQIDTQLISLKDLDAEQQQAELEAIFSSIFDGLVDEAIPYLDRFQRVGEGLGETLARVATSVQVVDEAIYRLGFDAAKLGAEQFADLSTALIDAAGGLDKFIAGMSNFVDRFASDSRKLEISQSDITKAFEAVGLAVPGTREGLYELMQTLDANTETGRRQIATLLELSGVADDYYRQLERQQSEAMRAVENIAQSLRSEINGIRSAADQVRGELGLGGAAQQDAVDVLRKALASGDLTGVGQAAQTAAQIDPNNFASLEDFRREQARTLYLLDALEREGNQQLSTAEQSLDVLHNIDAGIANVDTSIEALAEAIRYDRPQDIVASSAPIASSEGRELREAQAANEALLQELMDIKAYIRQTTKNTGDTRDQLERWHREGMPEERTL